MDFRDFNKNFVKTSKIISECMRNSQSQTPKFVAEIPWILFSMKISQKFREINGFTLNLFEIGICMCIVYKLNSRNIFCAVLKNEKFTDLLEKNFVKSTIFSDFFSLVKPLISRNFSKKSVRTQCGNYGKFVWKQRFY